MKNLILSVQHLLAMYAGAILVPIIVGTSLKFTPEQIAYLVTVDIFMCGVATFLQANKVTGTGLPIVLGCTFTAVAPMDFNWSNERNRCTLRFAIFIRDISYYHRAFLFTSCKILPTSSNG